MLHADLEVRLKKLRHDFEALDKRYSSQARSLKDTRLELDKKERECTQVSRSARPLSLSCLLHLTGRGMISNHHAPHSPFLQLEKRLDMMVGKVEELTEVGKEVLCLSPSPPLFPLCLFVSLGL